MLTPTCLPRRKWTIPWRPPLPSPEHHPLAGHADSMKGQPENPAVLQDVNLTCEMPSGAITRRPDPISLPKSLRSPAGLRP